MYISLYFCLAVVVILMVCFLRIFFMYEKLRRRYENLAESYQQLQRLNTELRSQRHDYLNHLQIVYGMMELEEYQELHSYLEPIYKGMTKTKKAIRTSIPAINALLMAKMSEAEPLKIDFFVEVKSDLRKLCIEPWELCKVLSNLIDNAFAALAQKAEGRRLLLDINENKDYYLFSISNNGPEIPQEMRSVIFKQGFTTKKEKEHGMGLSIVLNILKQNNGKVTLESDDKETIFTVYFSKEVKKEWNG